jgi:hypothetical protein
MTAIEVDSFPDPDKEDYDGKEKETEHEMMRLILQSEGGKVAKV